MNAFLIITIGIILTAGLMMVLIVLWRRDDEDAQEWVERNNVDMRVK